jgi:D-alanyl-D-alanine dipeptidase
MGVTSWRVEDLPGHPDFRRLETLGEGIERDLRYATADNFAGRALYDGLRLLDALRPHRVQVALWAQLAGTPEQAYLADPARGSIHSFGMAVDVTLLDPQGHEADMGSGFDEMSLLSHPALNDEHLALGALSAAQVTARGWLHAAMARGGFRGIPTEWWHFDHGDRERVRREFPRVD